MNKIVVRLISVFAVCGVLTASWLAATGTGTLSTYAKSSKGIVSPLPLIKDSSGCQDTEGAAQTTGVKTFHPVTLTDPNPDCAHIAWIMPANLTIAQTCDFTMNFFGSPIYSVDLVGTNNHHYITNSSTPFQNFPDVHEIDTHFDASLTGQTIKVGTISVTNCRPGCTDPSIKDCGHSTPNPAAHLNPHKCIKNSSTTCFSPHVTVMASSNNVVEPQYAHGGNNCPTLTKGRADPSTHSYFWTLKIGSNSPAQCGDNVTWNFSKDNIASLACRFGMARLQQAIPLLFLDSSGKTIDSKTLIPGVINEQVEKKGVQKVQLNFNQTTLSTTYTLGGMWFDSCQ